MAVTIGEICDAIETTLSAAVGLISSQSYDELQEGLPAADLPLIQVYWEGFMMDPWGETDRQTFRGGVRNKPIIIHVDLYATRRSHIGEDMKAVVDGVDALIDVLEEQDTKPYFGLVGLKAFSVDDVVRAEFIYGNESYLGARFVLIAWVF